MYKLSMSLNLEFFLSLFFSFLLPYFVNVLILYIESGILETGTPPTIKQFIDLCNAVSKVDLLHLHMDLKLQSNPPYVIQWLLPEEVQIRKTALGHKVVLPVTSGDPSDQPIAPYSLNIPTSNLPQESISEALGETTVTKLYNIEDSRPQLHEPQGTVSLAPDGKWRVDGEKRLQGYNVLMLYYRNLRSCGTPVSPSLLAA